MSRHRSHRVRAPHAGRRRRLIVLISAALVAGTLGAAPPLSAADTRVYAAADTTATAVVQDGDNARKTTLATCATRCEKNPRGGRDALLRFTVTSLPANAVNVRAKLRVYSWSAYPAKVTAHRSTSDARAARPARAKPGAQLGSVPRVSKGFNEWDVSALVTRNGTYTVALLQERYERRVYWASAEYRDRTLRPHLALTYTVRPAPPATVAPAPAAPTPAPTSPSPTPSDACGTVSATLVPSCGAWWGMYSPTDATRSWNHGAAVAEIEAQIGRRFDIVHRYHDFSNSGSNGAFPDAFEKAQMAEGRLMFFAWESRIFSSGTTLTWRDVSGGRYDAVIDDVARRIAATRTPVFMGFDHEPEDEPAKGSDADFVAAWRHVHDRFARAGADNAVWVWTVMGSSGYYDRYARLYPGDAYVDWVGYDPYNFYACNGGRTWKSPATTIGTFYRWLDGNGIGAGKPRMLAEFGTNFDPADPSAKRRWFEEFPAALKAHPKIKAAVYFNSAGSTTTSVTCNMTLGHTAAALSGFIAAGHDPYLRQPVSPQR
ncbi:Glycosyl hydrolase family 26 [Micromonospora pattaloongensis]|uniref:Glycosyl hydrolase family 26 n=1 Tax=Micromonospora pattaloongensis TaxID=405436 RepID=A0A1H3LPH7_9ACTN|nr:glycosyl hydrolase [Micromonospora pattaloongensis]SDY66311.1 Glycosyl hydrolase family 26 [Micromonospora pattaloongensis]